MPVVKPTIKPKAVKKAVTPEAKLAKLGLHTDMDLVLHLPMRYEDETQVVTIRDASMRGGESSQVEGIVVKNEISYKPRKQLLVHIADETGDLQLRFMNFYGSQVKQLAEGTRVRARGELKHGFFGAEMVHPTYKVVNEGAPLPTSLTPVYPSGEGLSQPILRRPIGDAMKRIDWTDTLPAALRDNMQLSDFEPAVRLLHYPPQEIDEHALADRSHPAWVRMKFDELLAQQLSLKRAQRARRSKGAAALKKVGALSAAFQAALPFKLTGAQQRVLDEIRADLRHPYPMQRLLQGDVGSGKTVVSALAAAQAIDSGFQAALMAPTEILADQHFRKIAAWMEPLGVKVAWLTGSLKKKDKLAAYALIESGEAQLVIGTHALIQEAVNFQSGTGDRRRAAPLRRGPAPHPAQQGQCRRGAAPADDVGHAYPAHAGDDLLRRPGSVGDRRAAAGPQSHRHARHRPEPARRSDRARARGGRRGTADLLGLSTDRRIGSAAAANGDRHARDAGRGAAGSGGRPGARPFEGRRKAGGDGCVQCRRRACAGGDDGDRGRRRCAECVADGDRACGTIRLVAAAPAARTRRARIGGQRVPAVVSGSAGWRGASAFNDDARDHRWI